MYKRQSYCSWLSSPRCWHCLNMHHYLSSEFRMQWSSCWRCLNIQHYLTVFRIQNAVAPGHNLLWLVILASLSAPLHGVLNAIVFGMDKETMQKLTPSQIKVSHSDCHLWHEICLTIIVWGPLKLWSLITCHVWSLAQVLPLCHCSTIPAVVVQLSLIHIWRCRRKLTCRYRWSPYH